MARRCYAIGGRVNFNEDTVSLCHGIDIGDKIIWDISCGFDFTPFIYMQEIEKLNSKNQEEHPECEGCSNLREGNAESKKIEIITINPMYYCQNRCIYCGNFKGSINSKYNPLPIIKAFIDEGLVAENCLFDWGGGEPTISDIFEETFIYLLEHGYMQRVNTNAIKMSEVVLNNLDNNLVSLRISLDSGNYESFLATKGRNLFDRVVKNVRCYREKTENLLLKYVITNSNSDENSLKDFLDLASELNVKAICIDTDMLSYGWSDYHDMLRFTEKELSAAHYLQCEAHKRGLNVQIGYVWTARDYDVPSRDFNCINDIKELIDNDERYKLPERLSEFHVNRINEFSEHIMPRVMASFETLLYEIKNKKVILYGAGNNGQGLFQALTEFGYSVSYFCDKYKSGGQIKGVEILSIPEMLNCIDEETVVIITPYNVKEIVKEFNDKKFEILRNRLYYIDGFRFCRQVLDEIEIEEFK